MRECGWGGGGVERETEIEQQRKERVKEIEQALSFRTCSRGAAEATEDCNLHNTRAFGASPTGEWMEGASNKPRASLTKTAAMMGLRGFSLRSTFTQIILVSKSTVLRNNTRKIFLPYPYKCICFPHAPFWYEHSMQSTIDLN